MESGKESSALGRRPGRGAPWPQLALVFSIGVMVIFSSFLNAYYRSRALFDEASDFLAMDLSERIALLSAAQKSFEAFFGASRDVERGEFSLFCQMMLQDWPFLSEFSYYASPGDGTPTYAYPAGSSVDLSPFRALPRETREYAYYSAADGTLVFLSHPTEGSLLAIGMDSGSLLDKVPEHGRLSASVELLGPGGDRVQIFGHGTAAKGFPPFLRMGSEKRTEAFGREWALRTRSYPILVAYDAIFLFLSGAIGLAFLLIGFFILRRSRQLEAREDTLRRAERMDAAKILARETAHDFNNSLSGIVGTLSLIRSYMEKGGAVETARLEKPISIMENASERAVEMVARLRQVGGDGGGKMERIDLASCAESVIELARNAVDRSVTVEWRDSVGAEAACLGDRGALERALMNLIVNAAHSMTIMRPAGTARGGTVRVRLERLRTTAAFKWKYHVHDATARFWSLSVEDSGVGIGRASHASIFSPFFSTKGVGAGTGLGLSMAYETAHAHSGYIDFKSKLGKGTTFFLYLPAIG